MKKKSIGRLGETLASIFLRLKFYKILDQNYRSKYGELDIVAKKGDTVVFVEVKTRKTEKYGLLEAVNDAKQQKMFATAKRYLQRHSFDGLNFRFDVIAINFSKFPFLRHYKNAFRMDEF